MRLFLSIPNKKRHVILRTFHHLSPHPLSPPHRFALDTVTFLQGKNPISWQTGMLTHLSSAASIHQTQPVSPGVLIFLLTAKKNESPRVVCSCLLKVSMTFLENDLFFKHTMGFLSTATYQCEGRDRSVLRKCYGANPQHIPPLCSRLLLVPRCC